MALFSIISLIITIASTAYSIVAANKAKKSAKDAAKNIKDPGALINTRNTKDGIPLVYGKARVGGTQVHICTTGGDNTYLEVVLTLSEGEINGIAEVSGIHNLSPYTHIGIFLNGILLQHSDYKDSFTYTIYTGTSTQNSCSSEHPDPLRYTAYLYYKIKYNRSEPLSQPTVTVVIEGLKVKDFTTIDDYDSMPLIYTNNIAHCVYDILTRPSERGGKGLDPARIDLLSFRTAAAYYDKYGWTCNMFVGKDQSIQQSIDSILSNGRSNIIYSEGLFKLRFRDVREEEVCYQITEHNITQNGKESSLEIRPSSNLFTRPNAIKASFYNEAKNFHEDEKIYVDNTAFETEGDYREICIELMGLSNLSKVIPMSYYYFERERWGTYVNINVGGDAIVLEPMDLVEITATMPGWSEEEKPLFRVESSALQPDGSVALSLLQEHVDLYNDDYDISTQELFYTNLLGPGSPVLGVSIDMENVREEVYYYREKSFTRWLVNFNPPSEGLYPFWDYVEVWLEILTDGSIPNENWKFMTTSRGDYMLDPVEEGVTYRLRLRSVSTFGSKEAFGNALTISKTIDGKFGLPDELRLPADMEYLTISAVNDAIFIYGNDIEGPDIVGYEFRISAQTISDWKGAIFLGFSKKPNWSLSGIRAGSYRIFCCAKNDGGDYSAGVIYSDFNVEAPKGYTEYLTRNCSYLSGTHNNTEYMEITPNNWAVKVDHTGGLYGTWTSDIIDVGETRHLRVQGDFILKVLDAAATWDAIWPTPDIWTVKGITKSWYQIYGTNNASMVEAKLKWGVNSVDENSVDKFELMSVDTIARYYQVEIKLTDPNSEQYVLLDGSGGSTILSLIYMR